MKYKTANAYYFRSILAIGGIESHLYYVAQKYGKYDMMRTMRKEVSQERRIAYAKEQ